MLGAVPGRQRAGALTLARLPGRQGKGEVNAEDKGKADEEVVDLAEEEAGLAEEKVED